MPDQAAPVAPASDDSRSVRGWIVGAAGTAGLVAGLADGASPFSLASGAPWRVACVGFSCGVWTLIALLLALPYGALDVVTTTSRRVVVSVLWAVGLVPAFAFLVLPAVVAGVSPALRAPALAAALAAMGLWYLPVWLLILRPRRWMRWSWLPVALSGLAGLAGIEFIGVQRLRGAPALFLGAALVFALPAAKRAAVRLPAVALMVGLAAVALLAVSPARRFRGPVSRSAAMAHALARLEALSDDDRDGFGDRFGGMDCDDGNAAVNPGMAEVPGNGIDENCVGGDGRAGAFTRPALPQGEPPQLADRPHIVLLVLDAVRADHVGVPAHVTPNIDRLAARGASFTRVFSSSSATRFSVPALLSGRWVGHSRYEESRFRYRIDPNVVLLPTALARLGYATRIAGSYGFFTRMPELTQAFGPPPLPPLRPAEDKAPGVVRRAIELLRREKLAPVFLYAHFGDAHNPYSTDRVTWPNDGSPLGRYTGEVNRLDRDLLPLLEFLDGLAAKRPVLLVVTADHGEAFGAHGTIYHATDLFTDVLHVPLVIVGPGVPPGVRIDAPVDLLDLGVTLAEAGGARLDTASTQSLWGVLQGKAAPTDRSLFAEVRCFAPLAVLSSVIRWPHKLIRSAETGESWLYDLAVDPWETRDLFHDKQAVAQALAGELDRWVDAGGALPAGRFSPSPLP